VVSLAVLLVPIILAKELAHYTFISWTLFFSITLFVILNLCELLFDSRFKAVGVENGEIWKPKGGLAMLSGLSITFVAYTYQQNAFPIY